MTVPDAAADRDDVEPAAISALTWGCLQAWNVTLGRPTVAGAPDAIPVQVVRRTTLAPRTHGRRRGRRLSIAGPSASRSSNCRLRWSRNTAGLACGGFTRSSGS